MKIPSAIATVSQECAFAHALASVIQAYWATRGYAVSVRVEAEPNLIAKASHIGLFCLRSDMRSGWPTR